MKKTFVFFPLEVGLAHVVRSLAVAEELAQRGHKIIFALPKRKWSIFKQAQLEFIDVIPCSEKETIDTVNIVRNPSLLKKLAASDLRIIKKYKPDATIVDFRPSAISASIHASIPIFCITGTSALPFDIYLPNFFRMPVILHSLISRFTKRLIISAKETFLISPLINLTHTLGSEITKNTFIKKINYIVPEIPSYLPLQKKPDNVFYVNHLAWKGFEYNRPTWINELKLTKKRTIYVSFGGTGFDKQKLLSLCRALLKKNYRVVVSSGTVADPQDFPKNNADFFVSRFLPSYEILKKVDLTLCHGGFGTMIESAMAEKPIVAIPFNPDQWLHSARFQELGLAVCAINSSLTHLFKTVSLDWRAFQDLSSATPVEKIISCVELVDKNYDFYKKSLAKFRRKYQTKNGVKLAADIIEKKVISHN